MEGPLGRAYAIRESIRTYRTTLDVRVISPAGADVEAGRGSTRTCPVAGGKMPRLTSRVFTDLAIWMTGFGLLIGLVFPPFCLLLGLPAERVLTPALLRLHRSPPASSSAR